MARIRLWPAVYVLTVATAFGAPPQPVKFNRDIRPIMSDTCFRCHGPDQKARMAGFRLDIREEALKPTKSGITPIVPGDPDKSAIVQRVFSMDPAKIMPPKYAHKELTEAQRNTVRRWVAEGAHYEGHWAYEPLKRPAVPEITGGTIRNPIDAFIQERLTREGMKASPEADKRTLLRRVTLDLTGVPPTPAELAAFLRDKSPDAYEKVVDRLLASPRYAEVQTMHWLDAVRYGDSAGFHGDNLWPAWPYRDYVLKSFRDNKPFDEFTIEQIAGDLLPNATVGQKVAAAYNRLNRASAEGGLQPKEYLAKYGADRVRTTTTVWLGATMGCAECHDHKFDPYTAKDFYSMKAFFADIKETGLIPDRGVKAWGSKLMLADESQRARLRQFDKDIEAAREDLEEKTKALDEARWQWEDRTLAAHKKGELAWKYQQPISAEAANGTKLTIYNDEPIETNFYLNGSLATDKGPGDGLVVASGPNPDNETYTITFKPGDGTWTAFGVEVFQDESLPGNRLSRGADRFVLTEVEAEVTEGSASRKLAFVLATTNGFGELPEYAPMAAIDGASETGWGVLFGEARNAFLALRLNEKLTTGPDAVVTLRLKHDSPWRRATIGRFRIAVSSAEHSWPELGDSARKARMKAENPDIQTLNIQVDKGLPEDLVKALKTPEEERTEEQQKSVVGHFQWANTELQPAVVQIAKLEAERAIFDAALPRVLLTERTRPRVTRILPRGNFLDESGEIVEPAIPAVFGKITPSGPYTTRLDLAKWIVSNENPLTARVFVNRAWRQFFGTGISKVLEDLGSQGEPPSHPELLDWLATEFRQSWDMKRLTKTIVMSHTYKQSSLSTPFDDKDPDNRLLARQSRFRVDAEIVHDVALSIAGLLAEKFGGPSVRPYQPEGYLAAMNFPKREYSESRGDDLHRRALYTQWQRTFLHPSLLTFDAPTREECTVNRVNSNTPLQALVLLNDPIFVEAARVFAQNILSSGGSMLDDQIEWAFQRALNRAPDKQELQILMALYRKNLSRNKQDTRKLAAMTEVARAILNLHETITRN